MKLLLPTSIPIPLDLPKNAEHVEVVAYDVREPIPTQHQDAQILVTWALPPARLAELPATLPNLRWIQDLMAGPDAIVAAGFDPSVTVTAGVGLHDRPVAEHTLALILAAARRLDIAVEAKENARWPQELGGNQILHRSGFTQIEGSRIVIWGFGRIGQMIARYLEPMGAEIIGVAQSAGTRAGFPVITADQLPEVLPDTDVLVNVLPSNEHTQQVINAEIIGHLPPHAWFVNVGRGANVQEEDLQAALHDGAIAGAALDVFATEPLPQDSPWWRTPNVIITPHSAGGRPQKPEVLIAKNLELFIAGHELLGVVHQGS